MESPRYWALQHQLDSFCLSSTARWKWKARDTGYCNCQNIMLAMLYKWKARKGTKKIFKQQEMPTITEQFQFSGCWHFFSTICRHKKTTKNAIITSSKERGQEP